MTKTEDVKDVVVNEVAENAAEEIACTTKPNGVGIAALILGGGAIVGLVYFGVKKFFAKKKTAEETTHQNEEKPEVEAEVVEPTEKVAEA